ncbi:MAG: hypothetical protein JXB18_11665 [Sedimentisphaerales bacterium]|nr:hypothetical protein [Sedimentisphaerales bacterium]
MKPVRINCCFAAGLVCRLWIMILAVNWGFAEVMSTFDTDIGGWMVTGDNSATWEVATGNPGGCLSVNDHATGDMNYVIAPPKYHGSWSAMTATDTLSAQIYFQHIGSGYNVNPAYIFRIAGPGGSAYTMTGASAFPTEGTWRTYTAYLNPADWVIETGDWNAILNHVNSVRITGEFYNGDETVRLDNVRLSSNPVKAFIPCAYDDFNASGTGDWSFAGTNGVTNPASEGNGGGYLRITDKSTATSTAFAPSQFLGDWSSLDGTGLVTADLRIISRSGSHIGITEFIRISGPGGSAFVTIDPADFPESSLVWKTFTYPLDSLTWILDSGTWSGLLQEVTECRIRLEFYDGTDTIGLDNFGRLASTCLPIDDPVQVYNPAIGKCGYLSMVNISSTAYNPFDDHLYGLIRQTTGAGGGLYPVSGPGSGIRIQAYDNPAHLIFDQQGNAFVSEDYSGNVYRKDYNGSSGLWVSGWHSGDDDPYGMAFAPFGFNGTAVDQGDILVADRGYSGADEIWSFSPGTPENERLVLPDPGNVDYWDMAADPDGEVYVCDGLDADHLHALSSEGVLTALALSTPIAEPLSLVYDSVLEQIYVAGGDETVYRVDPLSGDVTLVADGFRNFSPCCLEIDPAGRRLWVTDNGSNRVYEFCLDGGTPVAVSVGLQGDSRPDPAGWQIPLFVSFYVPGADVMHDPAVYTCRPITSKSADSAIAQVPGIAPGTYDVTACSEHTLLNVRRSVVVAEPTATVDMGTLLEGNAYGDNQLDLQDAGVLASSWLTTEAASNYTKAADFDRNGIVELEDLLLLASNWLNWSPIEQP